MTRIKVAIVTLGLMVSGCGDGSFGEPEENVAVDEPSLVMRFEAQNVSLDQEELNVLSHASSQPHVARINFERGDNASVAGLLTFDSMDEFAAWRSSSMNAFFELFGETATIKSLRLLRPDEIAGLGNNGSSQIADGVNVVYRNTGNESQGDADIDAVTVICGDGADCQPSN